jgi:hypothetical protein
LIRTEVDGLTANLRVQIALGKILLQAKADLKAKKIRWTEWFPKQGFEFSLRKAQRAMRYAKYEKEILAWEKTPELALSANDDCLGVFDADCMIADLLHKEPEEMEADELRELQEDPEVVQAAEIIGNWDQEKREQFAATLLKALPPERLLNLLLSAFSEEQLVHLSAQLNTHLKSHANLSHVN